jgi:hypothetical protein
MGIRDVTLVAALNPQKMRNDYPRAPESMPDLHGSNAPPASISHAQEKTLAVKEASDGHATTPLLPWPDRQRPNCCGPNAGYSNKVTGNNERDNDASPVQVATAS